MSFRERTAWIALIANLGVYAAYFAYVAAHAWAGWAPLVTATAALIALQIILSIINAVANPSEAVAKPDERDRLIDLLAARAGFYTLQAGAFLAFCALLVRPAHPRLLAQSVLLAMVTAELVRSEWQVIAYRRQAA
jgi:hypothetical protein